jgi:NADH dehydrogenase
LNRGSGRFGFAGFLAWLIHRAYHLYAVPTWRRKVRVLAGWLISVRFGRDIVSVEDAQRPRAAFVRGGIPEHHATFMYNESTNKEVVGTAGMAN